MSTEVSEENVRRYKARAAARKIVNALRDTQINHFADRLLDGDQKLAHVVYTIDHHAEELRQLRAAVAKAGARLRQEMISLLGNSVSL